MPAHITNAYIIFGLDLAGIRGMTEQRKLERILMEYISIPWELVELNKVVDMMADGMFVNGVPFLVTAFWGLNLLTAEYLDT